MHFYNSLLLIINILILIIHTQSQTAKGPGISGCHFMGSVAEECCVPEVKIDDVPKECTSILYAEVFVDLRYHVSADSCACEKNKKVLGHLDEVLKSKRPTYLYYGHSTQQEWTQILACEESNGGVNSLDEMKGLKAFLGEHPGITGLILTNLQNDPSSTVVFPKYSENLKKYLDVMKKSFPSLEVGVQFSAYLLIDQITENYPEIPWLDLKIVDPALDFYIISVTCFNDCTEEFIDTGTAPLTSNSTNYTLEYLKTVLDEAGIPKEKTYFKFNLNPITNPDESVSQCNSTVQEICTDKEKTSTYCSDNQTTLNQKGQFAKENGVGFVTTAIDLNDPTNACNCETPFISFYALLEGFNGVESIRCALFARS